MFNVRKIENAVIIGYNNEQQGWSEIAFPFSDEDWVANAKGWVTANKGKAADQAELQANNHIDHIANELEE